MIVDILMAGIYALGDYLSAHILTGLIPAFFIAGAMAVFISKSSVTKYFGAEAKRIFAYSMASISGTILAVCSCTVIPLFAGIRQRGAGLGPAVTFLYSGPALNVLAIVYSARLLGYDIGIARALIAIVFSVSIGMIMSALFKKDEEKLYTEKGVVNLGEEKEAHPLSHTSMFFIVLIAFMLVASSMKLVVGFDLLDTGKLNFFANALPIPLAITAALLGVVVLIVVKLFREGELGQWMNETWMLFSSMIITLLIGVFLAGVIKEILPQSVVSAWVGGNSIKSNLVASVMGSVMYFCTMTEVPLVKALLELGMGRGPALTLLLAGPSLSLPNMILIRKLMGAKKTVVYILLVVSFSTVAGLLFGMFVS
jgi:uncharacterized protein